MVLSKRWKFLWKFVQNLEYDHNMYREGEKWRFLQFVNSSLLSCETPVLESLHFKLGQNHGFVVIGACYTNSCVRELIIDIDSSSTKNLVLRPRSLSTGFGVNTLTKLKLRNAILEDVDSQISFPSLKDLSLVSMKYRAGDEFCNRFLSKYCPVLEDLEVKRCDNDNVEIFAIRVPSLKNLRLTSTSKRVKGDSLGFVIEAPSLKLLDIKDYSGGVCVIENKMPEIVNAYIDVQYSCIEKLLGSIDSVQKLYICFPTSMCRHHQIQAKHPGKLPCWSEPSYIPECLTSSLETFEWVRYQGKPDEKQAARFILGNSSHLKTATFYYKSIDLKDKRQVLMEELSMLHRSSTCQLAFKEST
ncbi:probable FBD-associated F-box protein At1g32375 [Capsella rubella]|uniref:probable FBD-associated F-box protein At1g32375 n=1 Tax=Capsella rubella TaxID=81985 RepID=UPI000CD4A120|nr:probable FBD-associated F-box protein At1g32375 [Capsella rubella]